VRVLCVCERVRSAQAQAWLARGRSHLIVLGAKLEKFPRGLHVVEVRVQVGKEDRDLAAGVEKVGDLGHGHKVADVRLAGGGGAPVQAQAALAQHLLDAVAAQNLLQAARDQLVALLHRQVRPAAGHVATTRTNAHTQTDTQTTRRRRLGQCCKGQVHTTVSRVPRGSLSLSLPLRVRARHLLVVRRSASAAVTASVVASVAAMFYTSDHGRDASL
jgi:hypothetical protein